MADPNILRGAEFVAAAKTLGLNLDEAVALVMRNQQKLAKRRGVDVPTEALAEKFIAKAAGVQEINNDIPASIDEYRTVPNSLLEFGEFGNQDELQNFANSEERVQAEGRRDPNEFRKFVKGKDGKVRERQIVLGENEPLRDETLREQMQLRDFGMRVDRDDVPKGPKKEQQGWIRRDAKIQRLIGPLLEDERRPGVKAEGGRRLFRGRGGQEVRDPRLLDERIAPFNPSVAPAPRLSDRALLEANQGRIAAERGVAKELVRRDREGQPPEELARRARAQVGREINVDIEGKGPAAVAGEVRNRQVPAGSDTWNPMQSRQLGVKGDAVRLNDGRDVTYRLHPAAGIVPNMRGAAEFDPNVREVREMQVMNDLQQIRQNAEKVEANNWRAEAMQNKLMQERAAGGSGAHAAQAFQNMGHIAEIGHNKQAADFRIQNPIFDLGRAAEGVLPINLPELYNAPLTDNRFAGPLQKQEQFIVDYAPGFREGGAFNDFPQVSINEQIEAARGALGKAKFKGQAVDVADARLRNLADLQAAANAVIGLGQANGQNFFKREDGKNVRVENPGINEVLQRGGMNARQVGDVARAFFQLEAAKKNPLNEDAKRAFFLGKDSSPARPVAFGGDHPAFGGGEAKIAMLRGEKVEGKEVRGQLQALDGRRGNPGEPLNAGELKQARMPFIAGVAGEGVPRANFARPEFRQMSTDQIYERLGPVNGQIVNQVIQRAEQQSGMKADGFGLNSDGFAQQQLAQRAEVGQHVLRDKPGVPAKAQGAFGEEAVIMGRPGFKEVAPRVALENPPADRIAGWPTRDNGPQMPEQFSAGGGGGGTRPPVATAAPAPTPGGGGGDTRPKWERMGYMTAPDGASRSNRKNREVIKYAERGRTRRGAALAAGGAVASALGLDALIGGERDRREEEVYS